eukprot:SAG31_NODE_35663_length_321_cov_0.689189_1_plen_53_part_01
MLWPVSLNNIPGTFPVHAGHVCCDRSCVHEFWCSTQRVVRYLLKNVGAYETRD